MTATTKNRAEQRRLLFCAALGVAAAGSIAWWALTSASVPLLTSRGPAKWVVFPLQPVYRPRLYGDLPTRFRRQFQLEAAPREARLRVRAMRRFSVSINGQRVGDSSPHVNWKRTQTIDVTSYLRPGVNQVQLQVANDRGPPALWLTIESGAGDVLLVSDGTWEAALVGSTWEAVRVAGDFTRNADLIPAPSWRISDMGPLTAPVILLLGVAIAVLLLRTFNPSRLTPRLIVIATVLIWSAMFINNAGVLQLAKGFDAVPHLAHIQYMLDHEALPPIRHGFETNQPPLYYVVSALSLATFGLSTTDQAAAYVLRAAGLAGGIVQVLMIFAILRLIFTDHPRRALIGWLIAAVVPVHLYLYQYATNEWLSATLATITLYVSLRMVLRAAYTWRYTVVLGVCFGASLLCKMTAIILIAAVAVMIGWALLRRRERDPRLWLRALVMPVVIGILLGGGHYARTWAQTGSPFVTTNHPASGFLWWQDPGYTTPGYFLRFDTALREPFYSGFCSFPAALYSTLFGDGMLGSQEPNTAPGWNYSLMMMSYLLSLAPLIALGVGLVACAQQVVRQAEPAHVVILLLPGLMLAAMVVFSLRIANFPGTRAVYGVSVAAACCALAAWGFDLMMSRGRILRIVVAALLAAWALSAYGSFWMLRDNPQTQVNRAAALVTTGHTDQAVRTLQRVVEQHPSHRDAHLGLIAVLSQIDSQERAWDHVQLLLRHDPTDAEVLLAAAESLDRMGRADEALAYVRKAVEQSPHHPAALGLLATLLERTGHTDAAIDVYRRTLRRDPDRRQTHDALAKLYRRMQRDRAAVFHAKMAEQMEQHADFYPTKH